MSAFHTGRLTVRSALRSIAVGLYLRSRRPPRLRGGRFGGGSSGRRVSKSGRQAGHFSLGPSSTVGPISECFRHHGRHRNDRALPVIALCSSLTGVVSRLADQRWSSRCGHGDAWQSKVKRIGGWHSARLLLLVVAASPPATRRRPPVATFASSAVSRLIPPQNVLVPASRESLACCAAGDAIRCG